MLSFIETIYFIFKEKAKTFSMDTEALEYPVYPCADNCCFSFKKKICTKNSNILLYFQVEI